MRRPVVLLARVLAYVNIIDIFPGSAFFPDFFAALVKNFRFQRFVKLEDIDIEKGIEFTDGLAGDIAIERFTIWKNILVIDTRVSTDASRVVLQMLLDWAKESFKIQYEEGDIKRYAYISDIAFESDANLLYVDPVLRWLSEQCSTQLTRIWQEPVEYRPTSIKVGHDPVLRHLGIAPFSIERRGQARFSDNQYFSEAPLPTNDHLMMHESFENKVLHESSVEAYP